MPKYTKNDDINRSRLSQLLAELATKVSNSLGELSERATDVPGLTLYRCIAPTIPSLCTYEPSFLVVAQGRKRVNLGKTSYVFGQSRFLLTSLELPVVSQVITASEEIPYLAFFLKLDISIVRDILNTEEVPVPEATSETRGMAIGVTTPELVSSCCRMMDLLEVPQEIPFFSKLIQREIIYRLLQDSQGARLRAITTLGDQSHRTAKVVAFELREASARGATGNDCRHEPIHAAPAFSRSYRDESPSISKAPPPPCRAATDDHGGTGCSKRSVRGRLRKPEPVQSRVQAFLWPATDARYQGAARQQSDGDHCRLTLNRSVARSWAAPQLLPTTNARIEHNLDLIAIGGG
jgi:hypothetical protein